MAVLLLLSERLFATMVACELDCGVRNGGEVVIIITDFPGAPSLSSDVVFPVVYQVIVPV